jgi:hypothetical protein
MFFTGHSLLKNRRREWPAWNSKFGGKFADLQRRVMKNPREIAGI